MPGLLGEWRWAATPPIYATRPGAPPATTVVLDRQVADRHDGS